MKRHETPGVLGNMFLSCCSCDEINFWLMINLEKFLIASLQQEEKHISILRTDINNAIMYFFKFTNLLKFSSIIQFIIS